MLSYVAGAASSEAAASATSAVEGSTIEHTTSFGVYFAGIIGIVLSLSIGYGIKRIYDVRRKNV